MYISTTATLYISVCNSSLSFVKVSPPILLGFAGISNQFLIKRHFYCLINTQCYWIIKLLISLVKLKCCVCIWKLITHFSSWIIQFPFSLLVTSQVQKGAFYLWSNNIVIQNFMHSLLACYSLRDKFTEIRTTNKKLFPGGSFDFESYIFYINTILSALSKSSQFRRRIKLRGVQYSILAPLFKRNNFWHFWLKESGNGKDLSLFPESYN